MSVNAVTGGGIPREAYNPFKFDTNSYNMPFSGIGMDTSIWDDPGINMPGLGFNNGMGMGFGGDTFDSFNFMGGMPSFGGGFPMFGGMNGNYWEQMDQYNQAFTSNQVKQNERIRNTELQYNAPAENVQITMGHLKEKIQTNNQDQIPEAYQAYKNAVRAMYGGTEEQVNARAQSIYAEKYKVSLTEDIRNNGNGSFYQAFLQSTSGGIGVDDTSAEYNVSLITGQPVGRAQREKKIAGHSLGGSVQGGVLGGFAGGIIGACKKSATTGKNFGKYGAVIGLIVGFIGGACYSGTVGNKKYK